MLILRLRQRSKSPALLRIRHRRRELHTAGISREDYARDLTIEQRNVFDAVLDGHNVFFTGPAGTGKSFLLQKIISALSPSGTFVTASTGRAAVQIGGTTVHSFAGIGLGLRHGATLHDLVRRARRPESAHRWKSARILVIDEISMLDAETFDVLELIAREIRESMEPFGGIQLILTGDFLQLPPVSKRIHREIGNPSSDIDVEMATLLRSSAQKVSALSPASVQNTGYAFQAESWPRCVPVAMQLNSNVRAHEDTVLSDMLEEIRFGVISEYNNKLLQDMVARPSIEEAKDGVEPTRVYVTRSSVDDYNQECLAKLKGKEIVFNACDESLDDESSEMTQLLDECPVPSELCLKVGAQVLLVRNISPSTGLVNGSRGVVVGFTKFIPVEEETSNLSGRRKSKDRVKKNTSEERVWGESEPDKWQLVSSNKVFPVVRFCSGEICVIRPGEWNITAIGQDGRPKVVFRRNQIPLILGWALTIHRCQGMTIDRAEISLEGAFEYGQAYVALSRVRSLSHLRLLDYNPETIKADPDAIQFHLSLSKETEVSNEAASSEFPSASSEFPIGTNAMPMPHAVGGKRTFIPDLISTIIPKPDPQELKVTNQDLLFRLYSKKGRTTKDGKNLRAAIMEHDPEMFAHHWEKITSGEYKEQKTGDNHNSFARLQAKANIQLPKNIKKSGKVYEFLRLVAKTSSRAQRHQRSHNNATETEKSIGNLKKKIFNFFLDFWR
eukprot:CAMPEP_0184492054 /NCGR_PEP_ID=MMETSP0113_2-20130426/22171_1 /TAXON_ID=91329 /ORGANISM="Norrisiella sphaerica, Strain BC52" /LENGTH=726 /DNA_ID=CAMNT_0026876685 /DNA_START=76 /DNA_END=2256 /DNA_ORIENTATION=+